MKNAIAIVMICTLSLLTAWHSKAQSPNVSGKWTGKITQDVFAEAVASEYYFELELSQNGSEISGTSYSSAKSGHKKYELRLALMGYVEANGQVVIRETKELEYYNDINSKADYCLKRAVLQVAESNGTAQLEGPWRGTENKSGKACVAGHIVLQKALPGAQPTAEVSLAKGRPAQIKDRSVKPGKVVRVNSREITLRIFDEGQEDGDRISLNFNGQWLLENHPLSATAKVIRLRLDDTAPANYLVAYAHNLGKTPPNTAAIIVKDGKRERKMVLNSDLNASDVIYFELDTLQASK